MSEHVSFGEEDVVEAAWTIVRNTRDLNDSGHRAVVRWARACLGLDDQEVFIRRRKVRGHTCGWARVDGEWRCVQDFYAVGPAPDAGCGALREDAA